MTITISNRHQAFKALIIGRVTEGETIYTVAVGQHGGIWYKGDWQTDTKWHFLSEKAFGERFPKLANETLNNEHHLAEIRAELEHEGLLCL